MMTTCTATIKTSTNNSDAVDQCISLVKKTIKDIFTQYAQRYESIFSNLTLLSGKLLRPELLMLSGNCCGKINEKHVLAGAAIELIHNASLLHDDVIDEGQIRRGKKTVNAATDNQKAILTGDLLLCKAFSITSKIKNQKINDEICKAATMMCEGELDQSIAINNYDLTKQEYFEIIKQKTASLFALSTKVGAMCSGANEKNTNALEAFGYNFGLAYQIADDYSDIFAQQNQKSIANDIANKRMTLPSILFFENAEAEMKESLIKLFEEGDILKIQKLLTETSCDKQTLDYIKESCENAINSLEIIPESNAKADLIDLVDKLSKKFA